MRPLRTSSVVLATLTLLATSLLAGEPANAAVPVTPGSFTGYAFDACQTPTQQQMDTWLTTSPFWGVGVYFGGSMRNCPDQTELTAAWVRTQASKGWRVLPIWVGPQASCTTKYASTIEPSSATKYAAARAQGRAEAAAAATKAAGLAIGKKSTLWYDLEDFDLAGDDCRRSALSFLSAWTSKLHDLGYRSGVYSNVGAAITALDNADKLSPGSYTMPDQIWYAWHNGSADTKIATKWVRTNSWAHSRIHQYVLDAPVTYGGEQLKIDRSFMDVGKGSVAPKAAPSCGVRIDFAQYGRRALGSDGALVKAAQCLLKQKHVYDGTVTGHFGKSTAKAVRTWQDGAGLSVDGVLHPATWTTLLADGSRPLLKRGSASNPVRRVQRALNAAAGSGLTVSGVFGASTTKAVEGYQGRAGLSRTGVVDHPTWAALQSGTR
jgi:hypothetical protein